MLKVVINDLEPQKVFALVNLLLKDIMALKTMDTLHKSAKEMVRYVKGNQVKAAIYLAKQSEE